MLVSALLRSQVDDQFSYEQLDNKYDDSLETMKDFLRDEERLPSNWNEPSDIEKARIAGENHFSPLLKEVHEWWRVSKRIAWHFQRIGELVLRNDFGCSWGRTCSEQAILPDGTVQRLFDGGSHE